MSEFKTAVIIQARMGSSRLPGKVLLDIAGQPMLARVVERARWAKTVDQVIVATTTEPADDPVADFCHAHAYPCYRGSLQDVLDRYYQAARLFQVSVIVRLTADCPLIDPALIDQTVQAFRAGDYDFACNRLPPPYGRTYPIGLDVEVCTFEALQRAWREADQLHQREHVMPYLYEKARSVHRGVMSDAGIQDTPVIGQPLPAITGDAPQGYFRVLLLDYSLDHGSLRWTVDTPQDLELVRQIYAHLSGRADEEQSDNGCKEHRFSWLEVLALFQREPSLAQINAGVRHKTYQEVDERIK